MTSLDKPIRNIALAGGGVLCTGHVGSIRKLRQLGLIKDVKKWAGSSGGSLVAAMYALGATDEYIEEYMLSMDYSKLLDGGWLPLSREWRLYYHGGLYKGDVLLDNIRNGISDITYSRLQKRMPNITFAEIRNLLAVDLFITGTSLNYYKTVIFGPDTTPDMEVALAARVSSSYVGLFCMQAFEHEGKTQNMVDGGALNNYPIDIFKDELDHTLGIKFISDFELHELEGHNEYIPINNAIDGFWALLEAWQHNSFKLHVSDNMWTRTITTNIGKYKSTNMNLTRGEKEDLIKRGEEGVTKFIEKNNVHFI